MQPRDAVVDFIAAVSRLEGALRGGGSRRRCRGRDRSGAPDVPRARSRPRAARDPDGGRGPPQDRSGRRDSSPRRCRSLVGRMDVRGRRVHSRTSSLRPSRRACASRQQSRGSRFGRSGVARAGPAVRGGAPHDRGPAPPCGVVRNARCGLDLVLATPLRIATSHGDDDPGDARGVVRAGLGDAAHEPVGDAVEQPSMPRPWPSENPFPVGCWGGSIGRPQ
jgi:hypothetical protein